MRRIFTLLHRWAGLVLGVLLVALGISGSALVFRADIERWQTAAFRSVTPLAERRPVDDWVSAARAYVPRKVLARITFPANETDAAQVYMRLATARNLKQAELEVVYVDPYRAIALGSKTANSGILWSLQDFHYALFSGETGLKINGLGAFALVLLGFSGPILWWPGWKRRADALRVRLRPAPARWRDLHAVSGVVICLALLLIGATGAYYAYRSPAESVVMLVTGNAAREAPRPAPRFAAPMLPLQDLLASAQLLVPDANFDELRPARAPGSATNLSFRLPGDLVFARHRLFLDPQSGALLRMDRYDQLTLGERVMANIQAWHYGYFAGRWSQWLWVLAGFLPAFLFGSGLWLWWRRSISDRRKPQ
jgi:uncharacterized iron-regulated membrane protein